MKSAFYYLRFLLSAAGLWTSSQVAYSLYLSQTASPTMMAVVCYAMVALFLVSTIGSLLSQWAWARNSFNAALVLGLILSGFVTLSSFAGPAACPNSSLGISLCNLALILWLVLAFLTTGLRFFRA